MSSPAEAVSVRRQNTKLQQRPKRTGGRAAARFSATRTAHCMARTARELWAASLTRGLSDVGGAVASLERSARSFLPVASRGYTIVVGHPFFPQRFAEEALAALQVSQRKGDSGMPDGMTDRR